MSNPLDPHRWRKLRELFDDLVELSTEERSARLAELCAKDDALRAEVEALLSEADGAGGLDDPVTEALATLLEESGLLAREEMLGRRVGAYCLVAELGRGGMGVVYLAERSDGQFEQKVALKLVKRGLETDEVLERFRRERQILARLEHRAIARLLDGGATDDGRPYFAMEHVIGEPITVYCDGRRLSIEDRLALFRRVCDAVEHAHGHLVVHCDLKPSNILVTAEGDLKVLDFGVAKLLGIGEEGQATRTLTRLGMRAMTPEYAAPEQVLGGPVSAATDVYALGVVLYEVLTGRRPYPLGRRFGPRAEQTILEVEPERPSAVVGAAPEVGEGHSAEDLARARRLSPGGLRRRLEGDLDAIVLTALRKEPERRYGSVRELAADLGRCLAGEPVAARPEGWTYRAAKFARRRRVALAAAATLLCLLGAVGIVAERSRRAVRRETARQYVTTGMDLAAEGDALGALPWLTQALAAEPDAAERENDRWRIGTLLEYAPRLVWQWAHDGPVVRARFSPDGARVVTASADGTARIWSVASGEPLAGPFRHGSPLAWVEFSPDGRLIATAGGDGRAGLWDATTGALVRWLEGDGSGLIFAVFNSSGRRVLTGSPGGTRLWDAVSGALVAAFPEADRGDGDSIFDRRGGRFVTSSQKEVQLRDSETGAAVGSAVHPPGGIDWSGASVSSDGRRIVTAPTNGHCATVWDAATGGSAAELCRETGTGLVADAGFDDSGRRVFLYSRAGVDVWDLTPTAHRIRSLDHPDVVWRAYPAGGGYLLTSTESQPKAFVWDPATGRRLGPLRHAARIESADLDASGRFLLTASNDGTARLWDLAGVQLTAPVISFPLSTRGGASSPDGKRMLMVISAAENATRSFQALWDPVTGEPLVPPLRHRAAIEYLGLLPQLFGLGGRRVVSGGVDGTVRVWSADSGEPLLTLTLEGEVTSVAFSPDGERIAASGRAVPRSGSARAQGGVARIWDSVTGAPVGEAVIGLDEPTSIVTFSPDGRRLAICGARLAALWDASNGRALGPPWPVDRGEGFTWCQFSPDGRWLLTGGTSVQLWDTRTGPPRPAFPVGVLGSYGAFSPAGDRIVAKDRTTATVLDLSSGRALTKPLEPGGPIQNVDVSSDGRKVLTTGASARVWDADTGTLLAALDARSWTTSEREMGGGFLPADQGVFLGDIERFASDSGSSYIWRMARDGRPATELIELASSLAGYRVSSEARGPAPLSTAELRRAWDRYRERYRATALPPADKVSAWHRQRGEVLAEEGLFAEALPHFDAVVELGPSRATPLEHRGRALAELGRLEPAEADFRRAAELRPGFPDLWSHAALLRLARGDTDGQRRICSELLRDWGTTENPDRAYWIARTCALVADGESVDRNLAVRLSELAVPLSGVEAESLELRGATLYRAGGFAEAREMLLSAVEARGRVTPWDGAFLALAHQRLGETQEARRWLARADAPPEPPEATGDEVPAWHQRLEAEALVAEARALLGVE